MQTENAIQQQPSMEPVLNLKTQHSYFSLPKLLSLEQMKWIMHLAVSEIYLLVAAIVCLLIVSMVHLAVPKFIGSLIDMVTNPQQYESVCIRKYLLLNRVRFGN